MYMHYNNRNSSHKKEILKSTYIQLSTFAMVTLTVACSAHTTVLGGVVRKMITVENICALLTIRKTFMPVYWHRTAVYGDKGINKRNNIARYWSSPNV